MLTIHFPENLNIPMYEYIYQCIKEAILTNDLKPEEKLPSKRSLANHLQISVITVENAYAQLVIEGYITALEKRGYFVNHLNMIQQYNDTASFEQTKENKKIECDLLTNSIQKESFPLSLWSKYARNALKYNNMDILNKCPSQGYLPLRQAITKHLRRFIGLDVSPDQIIIGAGTEYLYNLVLQLLGKDKHYALEDPGHQSISKVYDINGITYSLIPLDKSGLSIDVLDRSKANIVHISPAHHFPTGITMPIKRRMEILNLINERQGYIIEDDYDSEFRLKGKPISPLFQLDHNGRVIYINTFSKTLSPSLRISYMVLPKQLLERYHTLLGFYSCTVPSLEQIVLSQFIEDGHFERHINRMKNNYKHIRDEFLKQLQESDFYSDIKIKEENAGLHFLLEYPYNISDKEMMSLALNLNIKLGTLSLYTSDPQDSHTLIINYTGLSIDNIPLAITKLSLLFQHIKEQR